MARRSRWSPFLIGLLLVLSLVFTVAAEGDSAGGILIFFVWLAIIVGVFFFMRNNRQPFEIQTQTNLSPAEAIRTAVQSYTMAGWQVTSQTNDNATFSMQTRGSCLVAAVLLLIGLIPGLLYLWFKGRSLNANVYARVNSPTGTTVQIRGTARGFGGLSTANRVLAALSSSSGVMTQPAADYGA